MKSIYLTFDIETIISRFSFNPAIYNQIILGTLLIAKELAERKLRATFFISLSSKTNTILSDKYLETISLLLKCLSPFENISIQPHLHASFLPVDCSTAEDNFSRYSLKEQVQLLRWSREFLKSHGIEVNSFRPGGYKKNEYYYQALNESGFKYSSVMKMTEPTIDMETKQLNEIEPYNMNGIIEYPVTSVLVNSIKGKKEILNFSPDFFTIESLEEYLMRLSYVNINFHSFSMFTNRFGRENHKNLFKHNLKYLLFEKPLLFILRKSSMEIIDKNTVFRFELLKWLDRISNGNFKTYFIGE